MSEEQKKVINIDRFTISHEGGDVAILNTDDGEWVQFEDINRILQGMNADYQKLKKELQQEKYIVHTMKQHVQTPDYVVCPKCGYPQEDTGLRRKECHSCEFEWVANTGY